MSKILSFRGKLNVGVQEKIKLSTIKGKVGYRIKKFEIMTVAPGTAAFEYCAKVFTKDQTGNIVETVDFSESDLLAAVCSFMNSDNVGIFTDQIIFDNQVFNQDIFVYVTDTKAAAGANQCNYYIELETMGLTDIQATQLTLKNLRVITSGEVTPL
jgi:hypothetical protein